MRIIGKRIKIQNTVYLGVFPMNIRYFDILG